MKALPPIVEEAEGNFASALPSIGGAIPGLRLGMSGETPRGLPLPSQSISSIGFGCIVCPHGVRHGDIFLPA